MTARDHLEAALASLRAYRTAMAMPGQLDTPAAREAYSLASEAREAVRDALRLTHERTDTPGSSCPCGASREAHDFYGGCPSLHPRGLGD
jgi:hypothetical protein